MKKVSNIFMQKFKIYFNFSYQKYQINNTKQNCMVTPMYLLPNFINYQHNCYRILCRKPSRSNYTPNSKIETNTSAAVGNANGCKLWAEPLSRNQLFQLKKATLSCIMLLSEGSLDTKWSVRDIKAWSLAPN